MVKAPFVGEIQKHLQEHGRILFSCCGNVDGPFVIFSSGIHGNEPSGVFALKNVFKTVVKRNLQINGSVLAFIGNRSALVNGQRYTVVDLNRLWTDDNLTKLHGKGFAPNELNPDVLEMMKIDELISDFENKASGKEHYFIDLHTTSAPSVPFAVVDRSQHCIDIALKFPLPVVVNLNEYIKGTMLNYFDKQNFHGLVFEAGQHDDPMSITKHEAIIWLVLVQTGALKKEDVPDYDAHFELLNGLSDDPHKLFEIVHREGVEEGDTFEMRKGFVNFQPVKEHAEMGIKNGKRLRSPKKGRVFMPLYQSRGTDGYFLVKRLTN